MATEIVKADELIRGTGYELQWGRRLMATEISPSAVIGHQDCGGFNGAVV